MTIHACHETVVYTALVTCFVHVHKKFKKFKSKSSKAKIKCIRKAELRR